MDTITAWLWIESRGQMREGAAGSHELLPSPSRGARSRERMPSLTNGAIQSAASESSLARVSSSTDRARASGEAAASIGQARQLFPGHQMLERLSVGPRQLMGGGT